MNPVWEEFGRSIKMSNLPGNLICTVGTSLFYPNLKTLDPEKRYQGKPHEHDLQALADIEALRRSGLLDDPPKLKTLLAEIKSAHESQMYGRLADLLVRLPSELRLCGAEINSIEAMVRKGFLPKDRLRLILLVSDTTDGEGIGQILTNYFLHQKCPIGFQHCRAEPVHGLQDEKPPVFQKDGLPNLVRLLGEHYRKWGEAISINATGGYKAQIALAVAFGQATGSPVYYKHERFDQIIRFPQIPFTLDLSLVNNNLKLWADLAEPGASFDQNDVDSRLPPGENLREAILPLLEYIEEESGSLYTLSALGLVYWEAFRSLNPDIMLKPDRSKNRKGCRFRDDHYPIRFKSHVEKFYNAFPEFVSECHTMPYDGQAAIKNRFLIHKKRIIGEYLDLNRFGARFEIMTSAENELERFWLVEEFRKWMEAQKI